MAKAKFKVYSKRVNESTGAVVYGMSAVRPEKGDVADFGTKNTWGELQINCDPEVDAADEFNEGDIITLTVEKASASATEEEDDLTPSKKKKTDTPTT